MSYQKFKELAWKRAKKIRGKNPNLWRLDAYGNKVYKPAYGMKGVYSWEIDHKKPKSRGGTDHPKNLQVLQWAENRRKGDKYPYKPKNKKSRKKTT